MEFAEKVRMLIKERGISQKYLAGRMGVPPQQLSDWLAKGKTPTEPERLVTIARTLGVTVDYLIDDSLDRLPASSDPDAAKLLDAAEVLGFKEAYKRVILSKLPVESLSILIKAVEDWGFTPTDNIPRNGPGARPDEGNPVKKRKR